MGRAPIYAKPYMDGDEERFRPRADQMDAAHWRARHWPAGEFPGPTWTLWRSVSPRPRELDEVIGLGGARDHGDGDFGCWSLLGEIPRRDWPALIGVARNLLWLLTQRGGRAFTALALESRPGAGRVLERLGFARSPAIRPPSPEYCVFLKVVE